MTKMLSRCCGALLLLMAGSALADDAAITFGGNPKILESHPSIRMVRERVVVTIGPDRTDYDCTFVFKNEGAACKVRIGFPDRGDGEEATNYQIRVDEAKSAGKSEPLFQGIKAFRSYVDGKQVKTLLAKGAEGGASSWHTKVVDFSRGQTRQIRDTFSVTTGSGITVNGGLIQERTYIMSTGASWKGEIGEAEVVVRFLPGTIRGTPKPMSLKRADGKAMSGYELRGWGKLDKNVVIWSGFASPTVRGRELSFRRKSFEPDAKSNIRVFYGYTGPQ